ncbi:MAG: c-type cytochrome [Pirellulaceae bacterium]
MRLWRSVAALCVVCLILGSGRFSSADVPQLFDADFQLRKLTEAPALVTPIAVAVDADGRILVIESHTHHRPEDYDGPEFDRILAFDRNGNFQSPRVFYQGSKQTMSLALHPDGSLYVATRRSIFRLQDSNQDGLADQRTEIVSLETTGDYPHNGLGGLVFRDPDTLYFGMGENLGVEYKLVARDGTFVADQAEGGNVFRCRADGSQLERFATGFWNPFGNVFDAYGRLYSVDNDPDASPPCRLLHVVPTADYGYQFRYGRSGRHPLQAWNGELPGTLPMAAGTGEAPVQTIIHEGMLWVTSWGDHRIERYRLSPSGASVVGQREVVVQGDKDFRPVGIAVLDDDEMVFSDWVDRSYPVHGKGRLWSLKRTKPIRSESAAHIPSLSAAEIRARELTTKVVPDALDDTDPFIRQAAVAGLVHHDAKKLSVRTGKTPLQRIGIAQAIRWSAGTLSDDDLAAMLADESEEVAGYALRVIAERQQTNWKPQVLELLDQPLSATMLARTLATVEWLEQGTDSANPQVITDRLLDILKDAGQTPELRSAALRMLSASRYAIDIDLLTQLLNDDAETVRHTAVRYLLGDDRPDRFALLEQVVGKETEAMDIRADAVAGLAPVWSEVEPKLSSHIAKHHVLQAEALRNNRTNVAPIVKEDANRDLHEWDVALLNELAQQQGNADAGRRVFFRRNAGQCFVCHQADGVGAMIGPELTSIHRRATKEFLIQSILAPNTEVAPMYQTVILATRDGKQFSGLPWEGPGETETESLVGTDGKVLQIPVAEIESRHYQTSSIMPAGFANILSAAELADVVAFLMERR